MSAPVLLADHAPAKVNLTLRVLARRADGYHELESLVVFADFGDRLSFSRGGDLVLTVHGPSAAAAGEGGDNLVHKAARALAARRPGLTLGAFDLDKRLPVAAGLGGGSSDAAAALRLLAEANGIARDDADLHAAARATGADVPVCLDPRPRIMRGIGERLSAPLALPPLPAVLVNPGVALPTKAVFAGWKASPAAAARARRGGARKAHERARTGTACGRTDQRPGAACHRAAAVGRGCAGRFARTSRLRAGAHVRLGRDLLRIVRHAR